MLDLINEKTLFIFLMGIFSSIINIMAGGGSLLTLPLLIFYGLDANVANATNRVAIVIQSFVGSISFHKEKILDVGGGIKYTIPALLGALVGSVIAVDISNDLMKKIIAAIMFGILLLVLFKPNRFLKGEQKNRGFSVKLKKSELVVAFIIGLYAGFIQAGVGYLMVFGLVMVSRYNFLYANALKIFLTFTLNTLALAVFIYYDLVLWKEGLILALGSIVGTLIGAKLTILGGAKFIRYVFIVLIVIFILSLTEIINLNFYQ